MVWEYRVRLFQILHSREVIVFNLYRDKTKKFTNDTFKIHGKHQVGRPQKKGEILALGLSPVW